MIYAKYLAMSPKTLPIYINVFFYLLDLKLGKFFWSIFFNIGIHNETYLPRIKKDNATVACYINIIF